MKHKKYHTPRREVNNTAASVHFNQIPFVLINNQTLNALCVAPCISILQLNGITVGVNVLNRLMPWSVDGLVLQKQTNKQTEVIYH